MIDTKAIPAQPQWTVVHLGGIGGHVARPGSETATGWIQVAPATAHVGFLVAAPVVILVACSLWKQTYVSIDRTLTFANRTEALTNPLDRCSSMRSTLN